MVFDETLSTQDAFSDSAEPSSVLHGPQVALNIDPADAARTFINTMDILQLLLTENDAPVAENTAEYTLVG